MWSCLSRRAWPTACQLLAVKRAGQLLCGTCPADCKLKTVQGGWQSQLEARRISVAGVVRSGSHLRARAARLGAPPAGMAEPSQQQVALLAKNFSREPSDRLSEEEVQVRRPAPPWRAPVSATAGETARASARSLAGGYTSYGHPRLPGSAAPTRGLGSCAPPTPLSATALPCSRRSPCLGPSPRRRCLPCGPSSTPTTGNDGCSWGAKSTAGGGGSRVPRPSHPLALLAAIRPRQKTSARRSAARGPGIRPSVARVPRLRWRLVQDAAALERRGATRRWFPGDRAEQPPRSALPRPSSRARPRPPNGKATGGRLRGLLLPLFRAPPGCRRALALRARDALCDPRARLRLSARRYGGQTRAL